MNILFITDDQHRYDFFNFYGKFPVKTPALDRLKREGAYFPNAFANCPICMPARFTWLYGQYATQGAGRLADNHHNWPNSSPSLAHRLKEQGYNTALVGKLHSHAGLIYRDLTKSRQQTMDRGFDYVTEVSGRSLSQWYDCDWSYYLNDIGKLADYRQEVINWSADPQHPKKTSVSCLTQDETVDAFTYRAAHEYLSNYDDEAPFFLHLSFCSPHVPIYRPSETRHPYRAEDMPDDFPRANMSPEEKRDHQERLAAYATLVSEVDEYIGNILDLLEGQGKLDDTLVAFCTDHGDLLGEHERYGKMSWLEGSVKTPILMRLPGKIPADLTSQALIESVDVPLTMLEAAKGSVDPKVDFRDSPGQSFWDLACGKDAPSRPDVYSECQTMNNYWRMLRTDEWKYVFSPEGETLIHLTEDPDEMNNLAGDPSHAQTLGEMRVRLIARLSLINTPATDDGPFPKTPWTHKHLVHPSMAESIEAAAK